MVDVPYFDKDALDKLNRSSVALSEAIKTHNAGAEDRAGNPLIAPIEKILEERLEVIINSPVFYQLTFIAADKGLEDTLKMVDEICKDLKET